jgi:hypothetical protein
VIGHHIVIRGNECDGDAAPSAGKLPFATGSFWSSPVDQVNWQYPAKALDLVVIEVIDYSTHGVVMKSETKVAIAKWSVEFVLFLVFLGLNYWLVAGNGWLIWFLSSAEWSAAVAMARIAENRKLFDINDRQLVEVSKTVDQLVERVDQLESDLKETKDELAEMERTKRVG